MFKISIELPKLPEKAIPKSVKNLKSQRRTVETQRQKEVRKIVTKLDDIAREEEERVKELFKSVFSPLTRNDTSPTETTGVFLNEKEEGNFEENLPINNPKEPDQIIEE